MPSLWDIWPYFHDVFSTTELTLGNLVWYIMIHSMVPEIWNMMVYIFCIPYLWFWWSCLMCEKGSRSQNNYNILETFNLLKKIVTLSMGIEITNSQKNIQQFMSNKMGYHLGAYDNYWWFYDHFLVYFQMCINLI